MTIWMRTLASHKGCSVRQDWNGNIMFVSVAGQIPCDSVAEAAKMAADVDTKRVLLAQVLDVPYTDGPTSWYDWYKNTGHIPQPVDSDISEVAIDSTTGCKNGDSVETNEVVSE